MKISGYITLAVLILAIGIRFYTMSGLIDSLKCEPDHEKPEKNYTECKNGWKYFKTADGKETDYSKSCSPIMPETITTMACLFRKINMGILKSMIANVFFALILTICLLVSPFGFINRLLATISIIFGFNGQVLSNTQMILIIVAFTWMTDLIIFVISTLFGFLNNALYMDNTNSTVQPRKSNGRFKNK